ncbi:hypothetical protein [Paucilactobacillus hokkaidonensis]|uniref:hypothetical protein n=1 Tax=Paucilactobacillus hokkaidonensis TaxID=1193095 RepID=UPI000A797E69|nr:hypothetical protein [Paucilactobacillus hokkaidonensis]
MEFYYDSLQFNDHRYYLIASNAGLCFVGSPDAPLSEVNEFFSTDKLPSDPTKLALIKKTITGIFKWDQTIF